MILWSKWSTATQPEKSYKRFLICASRRPRMIQLGMSGCFAAKRIPSGLSLLHLNEIHD